MLRHPSPSDVNWAFPGPRELVTSGKRPTPETLGAWLIVRVQFRGDPPHPKPLQLQPLYRVRSLATAKELFRYYARLRKWDYELIRGFLTCARITALIYEIRPAAFRQSPSTETPKARMIVNWEIVDVCEIVRDSNGEQWIPLGVRTDVKQCAALLVTRR
jgi:hypothetical protein